MGPADMLLVMAILILGSFVVFLFVGYALVRILSWANSQPSTESGGKNLEKAPASRTSKQAPDKRPDNGADAS